MCSNELVVPGRRQWAAWWPGLWLALALGGQAAGLRLIHAGPLIHYQHYRLPAEAIASAGLRWALFAVILQAILVAGGLAARGGAILRWIGNPGRVLRLAAVIGASGCLAVAVSRDPGFFAKELGFAALVQIVNAGN